VPYIKEEKRKKNLKPETPGELNYVITRLVSTYLGSNPNYSKFNEVVGAIESCKLELYRRLIVPYEELKKWDNGDLTEFQNILVDMGK
jgi:hypothetical protein